VGSTSGTTPVSGPEQTVDHVAAALWGEILPRPRQDTADRDEKPLNADNFFARFAKPRDVSPSNPSR
jgi:hypothetical protein